MDTQQMHQHCRDIVSQLVSEVTLVKRDLERLRDDESCGAAMEMSLNVQVDRLANACIDARDEIEGETAAKKPS